MPRQCFTGTLPIPDGCGHAASGTLVGKAGQSPESPVVENAAPMHSIDRATMTSEDDDVKRRNVDNIPST